ncbi:MAG: bifunctional diaminohydroxyphosphoribosylaminopyrimidine deaminase/5-amino-6-(5-phosphoribosylamino)uracil reductase RibD [Bacteroidota bacterium]|nr:bifunctional diaminohydroxyphosphoribosylaminopyrimidine deaminase/5-amino-6-(5-phosphoribosylamino)uracil reductase RibD [Bacteroidota bacterium]
MTVHTEFMRRCFQLARKGEGYTHPNPMVGAVVVHDGKIIGEGFHRRYGEPHAEVNAIAAVRDASLLRHSTLYISLEPCSHYGKTPPCTGLITEKGIPKVVVATCDPNPKVAGKGLAWMKEHGIEVIEGILKEEARMLNRAFFVNQLIERPYVILKWAQSRDGFIDRIRTSREERPSKLSNELTNCLAHRLRTRVQGVMVGTRTALLDDPKLTVRHWYGHQPTRVVIDRTNLVPNDSALFNGSAPTIIFTESVTPERSKMPGVKQIKIGFSNETIQQVLRQLYDENIRTLLVEGGSQLLSSFIEQQLWDEAFVETSCKILHSGIKAPSIDGDTVSNERFLHATRLHLKNQITRNFL